MYCFEKHWSEYLLSFKCIRIDLTINICIYNLLTFVQVETHKVLHESVVEDRHLVAGFKTMWLQEADLKEEAAQNFFRNRQISSETSDTSYTCFWDPNAPLGPIVTWVSSQEPPKRWFSFRKPDERGWKSTLSTFETERDIVEYCVEVILRPQLTL